MLINGSLFRNAETFILNIPNGSAGPLVNMVATKRINDSVPVKSTTACFDRLKRWHANSFQVLLTRRSFS